MSNRIPPGRIITAIQNEAARSDFMDCILQAGCFLPVIYFTLARYFEINGRRPLPSGHFKSRLGRFRAASGSALNPLYKCLKFGER